MDQEAAAYIHDHHMEFCGFFLFKLKKKKRISCFDFFWRYVRMFEMCDSSEYFGVVFHCQSPN
jgi:hypothetical protein